MRGIYLRPIWNLMSEMKMYSSCQKGKLDNSEEQVNRILNLPSSPQLIQISK